MIDVYRTKRRHSGAAARNDSTGEAYISPKKRGKKGFRYCRRLPINLDPKRRPYSFPFTPDGLAAAVAERDRMMKILDEEVRKAELRGDPAHLITVNEACENDLASEEAQKLASKKDRGRAVKRSR